MIEIVVNEAVEKMCASIPDAPGPEYPERNIQFRKAIISMGDADDDFAAAVNLKCSRDVVFWFNTFVWTQNPIDLPTEPRVPVILFPKQEQFLRCLDEHINLGKPLLLEKSREQLASVACANYALWRLIYNENGSVKVGSFKKDVVDGDDYGEAILPKIDFTIEHMPDWMLPKGWNRKRPGPCRKTMMIRNPVTGSNIKGETCNKRFSRSGRWPWLWLDEFSHVERQEQIHSAVAGTTSCFVYTTTPNGLEKFAEMVSGGAFDVFELHWTSNYLWHPINKETGQRYKPEECQWNRREPEKSIWPSEWICPVGCKAHPQGGMPHSRRYDEACSKLDWDQAKIAQELDINYAKAGNAIFDQDKVQAAINHTAAMIRDEKIKFDRVKLVFTGTSEIKVKPGADANDIDRAIFREAKKWRVKAEPCNGGPLRIWKYPFSCRDPKCLCKGTGLHTYAMGGDTAVNVDGDFCVAYVMDLTLGHVVAEWHGHADLKELGIEWAKLCKYYGSSSRTGARDAWATVESNNGGHVTNNVMDAMGIGLHISRNEQMIRKGTEGRFGVFSSKWTKPTVIGESLLPEINSPDPDRPELPRLVNPFKEFWVECETFVYIYSSKTEQRPEFAKMGTQTRKQHDDRVMAMGMLIYGALDRFGKIRGHVRKDAALAGNTRRLLMQEQKTSVNTL